MRAQLADALREKYEVLEWVGSGGMSQVYLARHRIHGALFAVKVLSPDLAHDDRIVARFIQEARTAASLAGHPNIVPIFDIGTANGLHFLIMQYVEGMDLFTYLKARTKLSPKEASGIIQQVANALAWACSKNVTHRDLKPSNLYMDKNGRVVVLDFGIAKAADVPSLLTLSTERLGTPYYMSPEQIRGEHCDTRSDLYSLGIVFFELLAGRKPFEGNTYREIELAHVEKAPPDLRELDASIPQQLCAIIYKLLQKSPGDRYQSAQELIDDLEQQQALDQRQVLHQAMTSPEVTPEPRIRTAPAPNLSETDRVTNLSANTPNARQRSAKGLQIAAILSAVILLGASALLFLLWKRKPNTALPVPSAAAVQQQPTPRVKVDRLGGRMLLVPEGAFILGSDDPESPVGKQTASLPAFYIDEAAVSNANFHAFCEETGRKTPPSDDYTAHPDLPVTAVSFDDAQAYAAWIGKRLPSETEWEKAARGVDGRIYPWGNEPWSNAPAIIHSVLSYPDRVSPYGIYNMVGNVFQWTTDHYQISQQYLQDMEKALGSSRFSHDWKVIKGGNAGANQNSKLFWKTYMRRGFPRDIPAPVIGFRCVTNSK